VLRLRGLVEREAVRREVQREEVRVREACNYRGCRVGRLEMVGVLVECWLDGLRAGRLDKAALPV